MNIQIQQNYTSAIYNLWKIYMNFLKASQKVKTDEILIAKVCTLFLIWTRVTILHSCYNFALVFMKNAQVFIQSDAYNFFMYIIKWNKPVEFVFYSIEGWSL